MQKFTLFSILLSACLVLFVGDLVLHDYLNPEVYDAAVSEGNVYEMDDSVGTRLDVVDEEVELQSEAVVSVLRAQLGADHYAAAGFTAPVLKESVFRGSVFQFLHFADQVDAVVYQSNAFDGSEFVGSVYELRFPSQTAGFQGYLALRDRAAEALDMGAVNETNSYGDSSFYFNHHVKKQTVHLVVKKGANIYAFEYPVEVHEQMKLLLPLLP